MSAKDWRQGFLNVVAAIAGSPAGTIPDGSVTLAKLANLAQDTIIGRADAAGTGVPTALSAAEVRTILALAAIATSGSGADLSAGTVALAALSNLANATIIGRNTAGTGVPEAVTMAQLQTLLTLGAAYSAEIDLTAAGATYAVIPALPWRINISRIDWIPTLITNCTVGPTSALGTNSTSFNNISANNTYTAFAGGTIYQRAGMSLTNNLVADLTASGVQVKINTPATATVCKGRVAVFGHLIPVS